MSLVSKFETEKSPEKTLGFVVNDFYRSFLFSFHFLVELFSTDLFDLGIGQDQVNRFVLADLLEQCLGLTRLDQLVTNLLWTLALLHRELNKLGIDLWLFNGDFH